MGALVATATPASAEAFTPQEANFTMRYVSDYEHSRVSVYQPKPGCDAVQGQTTFKQRARISMTWKIRIRRARYGSRIEFVFYPTRARGLSAPFPATMRLEEHDHSALANSAPNDRPIEDQGVQTGCERGAFVPQPDSGDGDFDCRLKGGIIPVEERGRLRANWSLEGSNRCGLRDSDGYPGRTNYLKMFAAAPQKAMYRKRVNVLKATNRSSDTETESESGATVVTTSTDTAAWTMTLTRTSGWRAVR
jgi:hypothetical protein